MKSAYFNTLNNSLFKYTLIHNTSIKSLYFYFSKKQINNSVHDNLIYSKYYNNEPIYHTENPILNYEILDMIKVFGRLADHGLFVSFNITVDVHAVDIKEKQNRFQHWSDLFRRKKKDRTKEVVWYKHFSEQGMMNRADFKKALFALKFKWPQDSLFPSYNVFLFEKGLSKYRDSPLIRKKVENYIQYQDISDELINSCFHCFSSNKEYITAKDILYTFEKWNQEKKQKDKTDNPPKYFRFFRKIEPRENGIDWHTFKNKIDLSTIQLHLSKK